MFTGLIQEVGKISSICKVPEGIEFSVACSLVLQGTKLGDSISVNGVCQTVTKLSNSEFRAIAISTTLQKTNFNNLRVGDYVNLECALRYSDRLGGHLVQGHVNTTAVFTNQKHFGLNYTLGFELQEDFFKYLILEGSITINGISLTISEINFSNNLFFVSIIPHTWNHTMLQHLKMGDRVNIEVDVISKYVENFFNIYQKNNTSQDKKITVEWLKEKGF